MNQPFPTSPERNEPAPALSPRVRSALSSIHRIDGTFPLFRIVWGAWHEIGYVYAGEWHLTYRHHVQRVRKLGEPMYGVDGKFAGYSRLYDPDDPVLPAKPLIALEECTDIGIPRWFIELAEPVDEQEWEAGRYLNEAGEIVLGEDGRPLDFAGEYPDGGIIYTELYCVNTHDAECCGGTRLREDKTRCYGHYREPSDADVTECRSRFDAMMRKRSQSYGFRDKVPAHVLANAAKAAFDREDVKDTARRAKIEDEITQIISPHTKRLADSVGQELSGKDKFKYTDIGSTLATLRTNETNPHAYAGKGQRQKQRRAKAAAKGQSI